MRVIVIARQNTDYSRAVETFMEDFRRQTGRELEMLDPDTREGESFCRTYDIMRYPTVVAISDDGHAQNIWDGEMLPTISEVSYYAR